MTQNECIIKTLAANVCEAAQCSENLRRAVSNPKIQFNIEEPIAWTKIFDFNANRYFTDPEFYTLTVLKQKLWRWQNFPLDQTPIDTNIPAWLGHYPEYTFVGLEIKFTNEGIPLIQEDHPLTKTPDIKLLNPVDFKTSGWMPRILKWYDDLTQIAPPGFNITLYDITGIWWRGCLDLAIALRGYENFVFDTIERPIFIHDLLKWLVEQRCRWYESYYEYFNVERKPVFIGDDWINIPFISESIFADFVLPRYLEIEKFHEGITKIHSCGNQVPIQKYLLEIKSLEAFEISPWSDIEQSLNNIPQDKKISITIHCNDVLTASQSQMFNQLNRISNITKTRKLIYIDTSGLTPITPDISEFIEKIKTWTQVADIVRRKCWPKPSTSKLNELWDSQQ